MNEFVTKLLERLEDLKNNYTSNCTTLINGSVCEKEKDCASCVAQQSINIVNRLIEECGMSVFDDYNNKSSTKHHHRKRK